MANGNVTERAKSVDMETFFRAYMKAAKEKQVTGEQLAESLGMKYSSFKVKVSNLRAKMADLGKKLPGLVNSGRGRRGISDDTLVDLFDELDFGDDDADSDS